MRPDTPELDEAISVEEMNERLLETARQASIRERMAQLAANDLANPTNFDEDLGSHTSAPPSRAQTPPTPEYNSHGVITARSKGRKSELASGSETPANQSVMSVFGEQEMERLLGEDEEGEEDEGELPEWATVEPFGSDLIACTNSHLCYLLPAHFVTCLPITPTHETLLNALSDKDTILT
ncbi:unnamed protein product [Rhizoctonia solani]|nr:unnamed protein product [Rhizoctonia solani]